ncbi:Acetyltransferase (GNAT) [Gracilaria domingensis]|nr:Acetyltransferase (GNAT) [Gracilaria domingensis]
MALGDIPQHSKTIMGAVYNIGPYRQEDHSDAVINMCKGVYDGLDFVPARLPFYDAAEHCMPLVAECSAMKEVVSFVNIREKKGESHDDNEVTFHLEGLRVREDMRRKGIAGMMVSYAVEMFTERYAHLRNVSFSAVTDVRNGGMKKIFERRGWERGEVLFVWPAQKAIYDLEESEQSMVQKLLGGIITEEDFERFSFPAWKYERVSSSAEIERIMNTMGDMGAHRVRPDYYDIEEGSSIVNFLSAEGGERSVWRIDHQQMTAAILFTEEQEDGVTVIGAVVKDADTAETVVSFVDNHLSLNRFQMVFDVAVGDAWSLKATQTFATREEVFVTYRLKVGSKGANPMS